jgi:hypothetical protein
VPVGAVTSSTVSLSWPPLPASSLSGAPLLYYRLYIRTADGSPALPAITVTTADGAALLQMLPQESPAGAARRWLEGSALAASPDFDDMARLLENRLRREAGGVSAGVAPPPYALLLPRAHPCP